jgi:hypothetical protein
MTSEEYRKTEKPFMDQLQLMGWAVEPTFRTPAPGGTDMLLGITLYK